MYSTKSTWLSTVRKVIGSLLFIGGFVLLVPAGQAQAAVLYSQTDNSGTPFTMPGYPSSPQLKSLGYFTASSVTMTVYVQAALGMTANGLDSPNNRPAAVIYGNSSCTGGTYTDLVGFNSSQSGSFGTWFIPEVLNGASPIFTEASFTNVSNYTIGNTYYVCVASDDFSRYQQAIIGVAADNVTPYAVISDTPPPPPVPDCSVGGAYSCIVSFTPEDGTTTPSGVPVDFNLHVYVAPKDIDGQLGIAMTYQNLDQNIPFGFGFLSPSEHVFLNDFEATTSGDFYFSTSTLLGDGNYRVNAKIERSLLWGVVVDPFSKVNDEQSHQFVVAKGTFIGNLNQNMFSEANAFFATSTATSTVAAAVNCNLVSGNFDTMKCVAYLFNPLVIDPVTGQPGVYAVLNNAKSGFLSKAPFGYLTRFETLLLSTTTAQEIPPLQYTFGSSSPAVLRGSTYTINIWDKQYLGTTSPIWMARSDDGQNKNIYDIVDPYFRDIVVIAILLIVISDFAGIEIGYDKSSETSNTTGGGLTMKEHFVVGRSAKRSLRGKGALDEYGRDSERRQTISAMNGRRRDKTNLRGRVLPGSSNFGVNQLDLRKHGYKSNYKD